VIILKTVQVVICFQTAAAARSVHCNVENNCVIVLYYWDAVVICFQTGATVRSVHCNVENNDR
jgi:hypothetical protein